MARSHFIHARPVHGLFAFALAVTHGCDDAESGSGTGDSALEGTSSSGAHDQSSTRTESSATTHDTGLSTTGPQDSTTTGTGTTGETTDTSADASTTAMTGEGSESTEEGSEEQCGNGQIDPGEDCDDGNSVVADGCNNDCRISGTQRWVVDATIQGTQAISVAIDGEGRPAILGHSSNEPHWLALRGLDTEGGQRWAFSRASNSVADHRARVYADTKGQYALLGRLVARTNSQAGEGELGMHIIDANGELVHSLPLPEINPEFSHMAGVLADGHYAVTGQANIDTGQLGHRWLGIADSKGNTLATNIADSSFGFQLLWSAVGPDSTSYLGGLQDSANGNAEKMFVYYKFDSQAQLLTRGTFPSGQPDEPDREVFTADIDQHGRVWTIAFPDTLGGQRAPTLISSYDPNGQLLLEAEFSGERGLPTFIACSPAGNLVLAGIAAPTQPGQSSWVSTVKAEASLEELWRRPLDHGPGPVEGVQDLRLGPDGTVFPLTVSVSEKGELGSNLYAFRP